MSRSFHELSRTCPSLLSVIHIDILHCITKFLLKLKGGTTIQTCPDSKYICQNGGTCVNIAVSAGTIFGYKCSCPSGFTGELCETSN